MNTFTRTVSGQPLLHKINLVAIRVSQLWLIVLGVSLFFSALAIVYVKDTNRQLYLKEQIIASQNEQAQEQYSKLLLEQSALVTSSRIEKVAHQRLAMELPHNHQIRLVSNLHAG